MEAVFESLPSISNLHLRFLPMPRFFEKSSGITMPDQALPVDPPARWDR
jgi:hypothetical protein